MATRPSASAGRTSADAAYVLHHYDWSESSLILEVFSLSMGRVALVAKGAKKPTSNFRPVLLPLQQLRMGFRMAAEQDIGQLQSARWASPHTLPKGDALLAGLYMNELLLKLLPRHDAHAALFADYAQSVALLALQGKEVQAMGTADLAQLDTAAIVRGFELLLLHHLGLLPALDWTVQGQALAQLPPAQMLCLEPERGLCPVTEEGAAAALACTAWLDLHQALQAEASVTALQMLLSRWTAAQRKSLQTQLAALLAQQVGTPLKTRQWAAQMQHWTRQAKKSGTKHAV